MTHLASRDISPKWKRAWRALVRALSTPALSEADALGRRDDETVFQPRAALTRKPASPRAGDR